MLESSGEGIYGIDTQGRCTFINRAAAEMLGYRADDVLGQDVHALIHHTRPDGSPYPAEDCPIYRTFRIGKGCRVDDEVLWRRDGTAFPAEYASYPLRGGDGEIKGAVVNFTDITERKQVGAGAGAGQGGRRGRHPGQERVPGQHEPRDPHADERHHRHDRAGARHRADPRAARVPRDGEALGRSPADVINDILDFSKIEAGKLDLELVDFDLRDTLDDTVATLAMRAHKKGLELADHVAADVPDALVGDPHRLRQVLVNLVGNAIKFTERGEVVLRVEVRGADRGGGVPALRRQRHGHRHRARAAAEALPGLLPGRHLDHPQVRRHRAGPGDLGPAGRDDGRGPSGRERGRPGQHVPLHAPLRPGARAGDAADAGGAGPGPRPARPGRGRQRHEPAILQEMLANWGMKPTVVEGGREALAALEQARAAGEPFALVLLDAMMPEMDGFTLAERIRQDSELVGATLMMLSSANRREDAARCRELGVASYLTKPIRQSTLLDAIMTALGAVR